MMLIELLPPDYRQITNIGRCTAFGNLTNSVCNTRLNLTFKYLESIVAPFSGGTRSLPKRPPATQPPISSYSEAVMSGTSGGTLSPEIPLSIAIIPSSQYPDLPSRRSLAFCYPRAVSSPSAMCPAGAGDLAGQVLSIQFILCKVGCKIKRL